MIKRILKEVKEYKLASFLAPLFMVGEVLLEIALPFLMSFIIDKGVAKGDMKQVLFYGGIMVIAARCQGNMRLMLLRDSLRICVKRCFITFRSFLFTTLINIRRQAWLRV